MGWSLMGVLGRGGGRRLVWFTRPVVAWAGLSRIVVDREIWHRLNRPLPTWWCLGALSGLGESGYNPVGGEEVWGGGPAVEDAEDVLSAASDDPGWCVPEGPAEPFWFGSG